MTEKELTDFIRKEGKVFGVTWLSKHCELTIGGVAGFLGAKHGGVTMRTALCLLHAMGYELVLKKVAQVVPQEKLLPKNGGRFTNKLPKEVSTYDEAACLRCGADDGVVEVHGHLQCASCGHILEDCCGD